MTDRLFLGSEFSQYPLEHALFHVLPVPYEATVSYGGGTAGGPAAILEASDQLEVFDGVGTPGEEGIHTHRAVDCTGTADEVFPRITDAVRDVLYRGKERRGIPVLLGGEHSITAPAVRGVREGLGRDAPVGLIQIDAHGDLRDEYEGDKNSHACVVRRIHEDQGVPVLQIGVRSLSPEEVVYRHTHTADADTPIWYHDAADIVPEGISSIELPDGFPELAYLTVDVDGLDGSLMAATGTPVPGGLGWYQLLSIVHSLAERTKIVAFDVVELAPISGFHVWNYTAAELTYRIMGIVARSAPHTAT